MASDNAVVDVAPGAVWGVLADGWSYKDWVPGTTEIRFVDEGWPAVGTSIHFTVGRGPIALRDRTTVRYAEPERQLELEAHAEPFGSARVSIQLTPWGDGCLIVLDEHPLRGPAKSWHVWLTEAIIRLRHRRMLRQLTEVVTRRTAAR